MLCTIDCIWLTNMCAIQMYLIIIIIIIIITNNTREILIFDRKTTIDILDLRSLVYYKIKQGVLQQNLNKYYHFEEANKVW